MTTLKGYSTYIIGFASLAYAAYGFLFQGLPGDTALQIAQVALVALGLRAAIN